MSAKLLAVVVLAAASGAAATGEAGLDQRRERLKQKWEAQFRAADHDGNRLLSQDEIRAAQLPESLLTRFGEIDADHDGGLSPDELWAVHEKRLQAQRRGTGPPR